MHYQTHPLPDSLQPWLRELWELRGNEYAAPITLYPDGMVDVLLNFGPEYSFTYQGESQPLPTGNHVSGVLLHPLTLNLHSEVHVFGLRFSPELFYQACPQLSPQERTQILVLPPLPAWVPTGLCRATDIIAHLTQHLTDPPEPSPVSLAIAHLEKHRGVVPISELAREAAVSVSKLERSFRAVVGVTPKRYAQVLRFRALLQHLNQEPDVTPKDLVYTFGYTDGSHLYKDLQGLAEHAPTEVIEKISRIFTKHVEIDWESLRGTHPKDDP